MNSVILQLAEKYLKRLIIIFAVLALFRGHNHPGGGFIGGLMAGLAIVFEGFAYDALRLKKKRKNLPWQLIGSGLFAVFLSFLPSIFFQKALMTGFWFEVPFLFGESLKLGTPFLFDMGVFFVVTGVTLLFVFSLTKKKRWKSF